MNCWLFHRLSFALLYLQLFLFMCFSFYGIMCVAQEKGTTDDNELFKPTKIETLLKKDSGDEPETKYKIDSVENVFFAATDELMIALAKAKTTKTLVSSDAQQANYLVAEYIKNKGNKWEQDVLNTAKWTAQVVTNDVKPSKIFSDKDSFGVVTKNQSIYIFAIKSVSTDTFLDTATRSEVAFVACKVESGSTTVDKKITLNKEEALKVSSKENLKEKVKEEYINEISSITLNEVSAFVAGKDKKIVFLVRNKADSSKKNVTAFIQLKEEKTGSEQLELLHAEIPEKCYPYFFPWGNKIMMIPTDCNNDRNQKVKESTDMVTWNESSESFSRLWDVFQDKKGFTTTKINEKPILFTYNSTASTGLDTHLWISDGTCMADVGTIVAGSEGPFCGSVLYTNGELFTLYRKKNVAAGPLPDGTKTTFVLKHLKDVMSKITDVLSAWRSSDDAVSKLCTESAVSEKYFCATNVSKNGLVGFLSGKGIADVWKDGYDYSNATVTGGTEFKNGFLFDGEQQGAKWSVGKAEDQPYNFAEPGFTLLATVTIGNVASGTHNSIIGVGLKGSNDKNKVSLFCTKNAMWGVKVKDDQSKEVANIEPNKKCETNQQYQVALVYNGNKELSVYIDWEILGTAQQFALSDKNQKDLQFYFGSDGTPENVGSHVTVINVLLYNRPFGSTEIGKLKEHLKKIKETETINKKEGTDTRRPEEKNNTGGSNEQTSTTLPPDTNEDENKDGKKASSPSRTEDGGVGGGVRVFSLLLAVLCAAPLLHL